MKVPGGQFDEHCPLKREVPEGHEVHWLGLVQLVQVFGHATQEVLVAKVAEGQVTTHAATLKTVPIGQDVQVVAEVLQVWHVEAHGMQVPALAALAKLPGGQMARHCPLKREFGGGQVVQD
jgi:hypothetical protein